MNAWREGSFAIGVMFLFSVYSALLYPRKVSKPGFSGFLNQNDDDDESEEKASTNENPDIKFKISN